MEYIFISFVGLLFILACIDLVVGVGNDAVNFLVSAIGSRTSKFWVIMIVASVGIVIGAMFSNGMMEVARKGIFHPGEFVFSEIIVIFLAVMLTDIILLDVFNTFGFPTSTTVSLVFELLGGAVAISLWKIQANGGMLSDYINTERALGIISGILVSVVVAFSGGLIIQALMRLVFSFDISKTYKYFGGIWGGLSFAVIFYFMFISGFKGSTFAELSFVKFLLENKLLVFIINFAFFTTVFQLLIWFTKINILKIVVLAGTFALAMAFAGNDLVNFIGVPLAGFFSWQQYSASGIPADVFTMESLAEKVSANEYFLIIAGLIMVVTLWLSKKAKTVTETSVNLSRQDSGYERFGSTAMSRSIVRISVVSSNFVSNFFPKSIREKLASRFEKIKLSKEEAKQAPAFDLIRASVNLVTASILIAMGTALKLPLSTTYVTFMVAMGTSLSDGAWGRESAVYRVSGVLTVIGGWFITAFVAFTVSFLIANFIHFGGAIAVGVVCLLAMFSFYKSKIYHKKRLAERQKEDEAEAESPVISRENVFEKCTENVTKTIDELPIIFEKTFVGLSSEDLKLLKKAKKRSKKLSSETKNFKNDIHKIVHLLEPNYLDAAQYYIQVVDHLREVANATQYIVFPIFEHIDNNHLTFEKDIIKELEELKNELNAYCTNISKRIAYNNFVGQEAEEKLQEKLLQKVEQLRALHIIKIKGSEIEIRSSLLFLNILAEYKNLLLFIFRVLKAQKSFVQVRDKMISPKV